MEIKGCATYDEENNNDYVKLILHYRLAAYQPKTPKITDRSTTISKISSSSQSKTSQISSSQSQLCLSGQLRIRKRISDNG